MVLMFLLMFIKELSMNIFGKISSVRRAALYKSMYVTCKIRKGVYIEDSKLSKYITLFEDVVVISSELGDCTYVQRNSKVFNARVGKFCSIAANVNIGPGLHNLDSVSTFPSFYLASTPLPISFTKVDLFDVKKKVTVIENDVWIGEKVIIMDGVTVGNGAIIAAGAIVTKDVPPYAIYAGVPAKLIRYRFSQEDREYLINSRWWDWTLDRIRLNQGHFKSFESFKLNIKNNS